MIPWLRRALIALLAPHGAGDEILEGVVLEDASTELGWRLTFVARGVPVRIEVHPLGDGRAHAARSARLGFAYRTEGGRTELDPELGVRLCEACAALAARNEERVLAELAREAARADDPSARVREVAVGRLLEPGGEGASAHYTLSPYVGCLIGCRFCYAQSRLSEVRRLVGLPDVPWGSWVDVRVDAPEVLARELTEREPRPLKLCPIVSDPYHAVERDRRLTRRCLERVAEAAAVWPTFVLTRSTLARRDLDVLGAMPRAWLGASVPTVDDDVRRHFEPRAASVQERLSLLRDARSAGVATFAVVQPLLPGSVTELARRLAEVADSVSVDVLRGVEGAQAQFADPRYASAADDDWQSARATELCEALDDLGVPRWDGELPPTG